MAGWKYHGANIQVPFTADIPKIYRFGKSRAWIVQETLNSVEPWRKGESPIHTETVRSRMEQLVVPVDGKAPMWAKHRGHHAQRVQLSPFVMVNLRFVPITNLFTVELTQTVDRPKLVRAYPGDYIPPLPWMVSAREAPGGVSECLRFWRCHAYVFHRGLTVPDSQASRPPTWFTR